MTTVNDEFKFTVWLLTVPTVSYTHLDVYKRQDLLNGKAIERAHDEGLLETATQILEGKLPATALALTGTAGTGKSTALMSLALKLSGSGIPVVWVDKESEAGPARIRQRVREFKDKVVLAIDDADLYGRELLACLLYTSRCV